MRPLLIVPWLVFGLLGVAFTPTAARAAGRPDAAVGVWVSRIRPSDDMAGARVVVTATHARPARQVLSGDGEGMDFTELRFTGGARSTYVVITPLVPGGMRLVSGGCDRKGFNGAATGEAPFDVPALNGHVAMTLGNRQSASCRFVLGPAGFAPNTSTAMAAAPAGPAAASRWLELTAAFVVGMAFAVRRTTPRRHRR